MIALCLRGLGRCDGNALLLSAAPLHRENLMGHLWFQLNFPQEQTIVSDHFNVIFQP